MQTEKLCDLDSSQPVTMSHAHVTLVSGACFVASTAAFILTSSLSIVISSRTMLSTWNGSLWVTKKISCIQHP